MIFVNLTDEQREGLHQFSRHEVGRVALRAHIVLLSGRKYPVPQIAAIHDCGPDVVRNWLDRYERLGLPGLRDDPRSGRPLKYADVEQIIDTQASQSPACSGHVQGFWTVALLTAFLCTRFLIGLSRSTIRRYLKAADWRWCRPRLAPASVLPSKNDPQREQKEAAVAAALTEALSGQRRLVYLDECDLQLLPIVRSMWMKGPRVRVPTPGTNAKQAFFGALDCLTGAWHFLTETRKLAVHLVSFLQQIATAYPEGTITLVMDNVITHRARVVTRWLAEHPRINVLWLPRYAAHEANPVERIWGLMKDAVAANRLCGSISALVEEAKRFFRRMPAYPVAASV